MQKIKITKMIVMAVRNVIGYDK